MVEAHVNDLTPREREVVVLIGRDQLAYKAAARRMAHRYRNGERISEHTVREYARTIQRRVGSRLPPRAALTELYWSHRSQFDGAA